VMRARQQRLGDDLIRMGPLPSGLKRPIIWES